MANITRIKNNQITDQTIEYTKIKPGTLVGTVFNANITLNSNVTIVGNLDVSGTTTTVQSTNTYINDPLVIFNNGFASTPAYDIGILVNRNLTATAPYGSVNAALIWQEAAKGFAGVMTTETGTTAGTINNSGYANLFIGNIYANTITVRDTVDSTSKTTGAMVIAGGLGVTKTMYANAIEGTPIGALYPSTGNFTTITTGGLQAAAIGNATPGTGAFTTLTSNDQTTFTAGTDSTSIGSGALIVYGGVSVAKNITASSAVITTLNVTNYSTANAVITGGYADNFPIGANVEAPGRFSTLVTTSTAWHAGNLVANSQTTSTSTTTGALVVVGGAGISGNLNVGSNAMTDVHMIRGNVVLAPNPTHDMADSWLHVNGSNDTPQPESSLVHLQGADGLGARIAIDTNSNTAGNGAFIGGRRARGTAASPSAAQAHDRLLHIGGRGFGTTGYLSSADYASPAGIDFHAAENNTDSAQGTYIEFYTTSNGTITPVNRLKIDQTGNVVITQTTNSTTTTTGALVVAGGVGIANDVIVGGLINATGGLTGANLVTTNGGVISNSTTGYLLNETATTINIGAAATTINVGNSSGTTNISGIVKVGGNIVATATTASTNTSTGALVVAGGAGINGAVNIGGITKVNDSSDSTSITTGALVVTGGVGIAKKLTVGEDTFIGGNLTVQGDLTYINTSTLTVEDTILELNTGSNGSPLSTATINDVGVRARYYDTTERSAFFGRARDTGYFEYYGLATETSGNIAGTYGTIKSGELLVANNTSASSTTTGALQVAGGAGIAGQLYVGGLIQAGTAEFASINNTPIGNATPSTGAFTTLTASSTLDVTGVATLNGNVVAASGTASSSTTTGALVVAGGVGVSGNEWIGGTLNVAGATTLQSTLGVTGATTLSTATAGGLQAQAIGNVTPGTGAFTTLTTTDTIISSGNVVAASGTASSSTTTGALVVAGGVGVSGAIFAGSTIIGSGNVVANSGTASTNTTTGALVVVGGVGVSGALNVGGTSTQTGSASFGSTVVAAGNIIAGSGTASTSTTTGALVVVGGAGVSGNITIGGAVDVTGDVYVQGADIITSQSTFNLLNVNATTVNAFGAATTVNTGNASGTTNMSGVVKVGGNLVAISGTNSTSPTTGAVVINNNGGLGVTGNVFFANAVTINSTMTAGQDFIVKGDTNETLIWARPNATYDQVLIGNSAAVGDLVQGAKLQINSTDSMLIPTGTNAQRPSSIGFTDVTGMLRYNTTLGYLEFYTGSSWDGVTTQFTVITDEQFTGDGVTTDFNLGGATTTAGTIVSINGVLQLPTLAYSITGAGLDVLTFVEAPSGTDVIDVRRLITTQSVSGIASTNGFMQYQVDNSGAYVYTGSSSTAVTTMWDTSGAMINKRANTTVATNGVATTIDSFFANTHSSAEYTVTATIQGTNIREIAKIIVVHDSSTAYRNVYGVISTSGNTLVTYTATVSDGSVLLQATTANDNTIFRIAKNYQAI